MSAKHRCLLQRNRYQGSIEVGIDEAGRGSLIGNVYAGAVILPPDLEHELLYDIKDSKKISRKKRIMLRDFIEQHAIVSAVGWATPEEIDQHNILQATYMAMHRALDKIDTKFDLILVDGNGFKPYMSKKGEFIKHDSIVDGDNTYMAIACASILAKVYHDEHIMELLKNSPDQLQYYNLENNMGYGTPAHIDALKKHGATEFHRRSFGIVREYI